MCVSELPLAVLLFGQAGKITVLCEPKHLNFGAAELDILGVGSNDNTQGSVSGSTRKSSPQTTVEDT
jgi:hypothetical protein